MTDETSPTTPAAPAVEPITYEPPTVTIAGQSYPLRRLGLGDVFTVTKILGRGLALIGPAKRSEDGKSAELDVGTILRALVASMTQNQEDVLRLIASVIGVGRDELDDPARFPMDTITIVGEALAEHQDLAAFLAGVRRLGDRLPEIQTRSAASSG